MQHHYYLIIKACSPAALLTRLLVKQSRRNWILTELNNNLAKTYPLLFLKSRNIMWSLTPDRLKKLFGHKSAEVQKNAFKDLLKNSLPISCAHFSFDMHKFSANTA